VIFHISDYTPFLTARPIIGTPVVAMPRRGLSNFWIEADRLQIVMINDDPDGLPSYDRAFTFSMKPTERKDFTRWSRR
jgi:hypothetical protein